MQGAADRIVPTPAPPNFRCADELSAVELRALDPRRTLCVCAVSALEVSPRLAALRHRDVHAVGGRGRLALPDALEALAGSIGWLRNARSGYGRPPGAPRVSYSGWPAVASAELGRAYAELSVRACLADAEAVLAGRIAPEAIRSIASDPPFIQPNFWRWLAAGAGAAALALRTLL